MGIHKLTTNEFIRRSNLTHNNKYDYSKSIYIGSHEKIEIICPIHGSFFQLACNHIQKYGCPKCAKIQSAKTSATNGSATRYTNEKFIEKAKKIHGDKFDYSKIKYVNIDTKIEIICPIHGSFFQIPRGHFKKKGCNKCRYENSKYTFEDFIEKAKKIHGNKYDYSKSEYLTQKKNIVITCPKHGDFSQRPDRHLIGRGCSKCAIDNIIESLSKSTYQFIEDSKKIHGNKYDYSKTVYKNGKKNVVITCPKHGDFSQRPTSHLRNHGCPGCNLSKGENLIRIFLENNQIQYETQKTFSGCKYKNKLRFDFYIPSLKLLIEVDGIQHFSESIDRGFGFNGRVLTQQEYELSNIRDKIKDQYALDNDLKLLRIPYKNKSDLGKMIPILERILITSDFRKPIQ